MTAEVVAYPNDSNSAAKPDAYGANGPTNRTLDGSGMLCMVFLLHWEETSVTRTAPDYADFTNTKTVLTSTDTHHIGIIRKSE